MDKVSKEGYILKSGKTIRYDTDVGDLDVKDINDLNNEVGTKWDVFVIHREVRIMADKMENNFIKLREVIETNKLVITELINERIEELADNGLGKIIRNRVDNHLKNKGIKIYHGFKGFLRDFILIAASVVTGVGLFKILGG